MELSPTSCKLCMELVNVLGKANAGSWASFRSPPTYSSAGAELRLDAIETSS